MSGLGPSFTKIWTCGSSPRSESRNTWTRIETSTIPVVLSTFGIFFGSIQMISCRDWWPWIESDYITMTRRQSNNQWSGGIASHPATKNSECKNPLEKFSPRFFWDQDGILLIGYLPKGQIINTEYCSSPLLYWRKWRTFWRKNDALSSPIGSCSCTTMPRLTGHLQPRRNWPTWASNILITHTILRIWHRLTTTCFLDWKNNWKVAIFLPTRWSLLPRRPGWTDNILIFFWVACKS